MARQGFIPFLSSSIRSSLAAKKGKQAGRLYRAGEEYPEFIERSRLFQSRLSVVSCYGLGRRLSAFVNASSLKLVALMVFMFYARSIAFSICFDCIINTHSFLRCLPAFACVVQR